MRQSPIINSKGVWTCAVCDHKYSSMDYWEGGVRGGRCPTCGIANKKRFSVKALLERQIDWQIGVIHDDE